MGQCFLRILKRNFTKSVCFPPFTFRGKNCEFTVTYKKLWGKKKQTKKKNKKRKRKKKNSRDTHKKAKTFYLNYAFINQNASTLLNFLSLDVNEMLQ